MNLLASIGTSAWARGFKPVTCGGDSCNRWLTERQLSVLRVGVTMADVWYCSYRCFRAAAEDCFVKLLAVRPLRHQTAQIPFGLTLVRMGLLDDAQHNVIAEIERASKREVGDITIELGWIAAEQVTKARAAQWNCPVFPLSAGLALIPHSIPFTLMRQHAMVPLSHVAAGNRLFIGFRYQIEYAALFAIEQVLGCATQPCFVLPQHFDSLLEQHRNHNLSRERFIGEAEDGPAMASSLCATGAAINADHIIIVRCGDLLWARLRGGTRLIDLFFKTYAAADHSLRVD